MFKTFKDLLNQSQINLAELLEKIDSNVDLKSFFTHQADPLKTLIHHLTDQEKVELGKWLDNIDTIKNDSAMSSSDKAKKLNELPTSDMILLFFQKFLDLILSKIPFDNKDIIKTGLATLGLLVSAKNPRLAGISSIALIAFRTALPRMVLSEQFNKISDFLKAELKAEKN